ncbi:GNAT family N-acetyltransferase [Cytophaga aurantiaca]|uniref:GNAT family N-acetyltransferase n=1 Tax=Cytophaga aurantiaca TaxID=29530 RepID=UPI00037F3C9C|nr:GNAT family protein [Cytophaga aurantiaca]
MNTIFEKHPYKIILQHKPDQAVISLLKHTLWGTKETVYQHQDTEENIQKVPDPLFFSLQKQDEVIGTCCFSKTTMSVNNNKYDFWYSRYFSIDKQKQGGIFGSMILKHIRNYFEQHTLVQSVFYAYVDASNIRSQKLLKYIGFKKLRSFETLTFSRLYPKKDKNVSLIDSTDKETMLDLLKESYKDFLLTDFTPKFCDDSYYVLKKENEILAGVRVHTAHWVIRSLSGLAGKVIIKILPHIPVLRRLFNPREFRFLAFDGVYIKDGHEKELFALMESVCSSLKVNTGLLWMDSESALYHKLKAAGNWGIMDKLKENIPAHVVAAFKNIPKEELEKISSSPIYISAMNII